VGASAVPVSRLRRERRRRHSLSRPEIETEARPLDARPAPAASGGRSTHRLEASSNSLETKANRTAFLHVVVIPGVRTPRSGSDESRSRAPSGRCTGVWIPSAPRQRLHRSRPPFVGRTEPMVDHGAGRARRLSFPRREATRSRPCPVATASDERSPPHTGRCGERAKLIRVLEHQDSTFLSVSPARHSSRRIAPIVQSARILPTDLAQRPARDLRPTAGTLARQETTHR